MLSTKRESPRAQHKKRTLSLARRAPRLSTKKRAVRLSTKKRSPRLSTKREHQAQHKRRAPRLDSAHKRALRLSTKEREPTCSAQKGEPQLSEESPQAQHRREPLSSAQRRPLRHAPSPSRTNAHNGIVPTTMLRLCWMCHPELWLTTASFQQRSVAYAGYAIQN